MSAHDVVEFSPVAEHARRRAPIGMHALPAVMRSVARVRQSETAWTDVQAGDEPVHGGRRVSAPPNKGMKLTSVERIGRSQLIPGVRPTGLRRQNRLTDDGLPATECWLEGCETPYRWSEGKSYGPPACRLRTTGLEA